LSQKNIGRVVRTRRSEVWLATKTHDRTYDGSMRLLEEIEIKALPIVRQGLYFRRWDLGA
jgi:hypothetical protein